MAPSSGAAGLPLLSFAFLRHLRTLSATPLCFAAPGDVTTLGVSAKVQAVSRLIESLLYTEDEQKEKRSEYQSQDTGKK